MKKLILAAAIAAMAFSATAQTQLKVSTGSPSGNYSRMFKEFQEVCKDQIMQIEVNSTGAVQNMDRLLGNEVNAGIVQTDVLFYRARNEDLSNVKTLFSLYPEEVHIVTTAVSKIVEGGVMGVGAKPINLNKVEDLANRTVVAWGGSFVTAQVIRLQTEIGFQVMEVPDFKTAKTLVETGKAAALLMVGGQPMKDVSDLGNAWKLVSFSEASIAKLKSVYAPAKVTYASMGTAGSGIPTVATEALYVTRAYKTPKFIESLSALRACFTQNVPELAEATGKHPKWQKVDVTNKGKWSYYELPQVVPAKK